MNKGKVPESVLNRSVLKGLKKSDRDSKAGIGVDAGCFCAADRELMMSTAAVSGSEPGNGELCVFRAVNSMAAAGGKPLALALSVVAPKEDSEGFIKRIMDEAARACGLCEVKIVSGNTIVGDSPSVTAVITGEKAYALKSPDRNTDRILIMTGHAGNAGAAMLAESRFARLNERLTAEFIEKAVKGFEETACFKKAYEIIEATKGVCALHDVSEGGVFGAVWELCEREKVGCTVNLKDIPIKQAAVEVCELLDVSPFQLRGDGSLLAIVEDTPDNKALGQVIGHINETNDRTVVNGEEKRFLEPNRVDTYYGV